MTPFYRLLHCYAFYVLPLAVIACQPEPLRPEVVVVRQPADIHPVEDLRAVPYILYDVEVDLSALPVDQKKDGFLSVMLPSVLAVKFNLDARFEAADAMLRKLHRTGKIPYADSVWLSDMATAYHADDWWDLRRRLATFPVSIVLAQAAVESGWGSSRFFTEANNIFGVWSFDPGEQRIRADAFRGNNPVFLRAYRNTAASIEDYYQVLARSFAFRQFRKRRVETDDPLELIRYLSNYSELRSVYVNKLRDVILQNELRKYDSAKLDVRYTRGVDELFY